jgi:ubiquinone/menaquinone biosynthesis C-methylase UbiE
MNNIIDLGCGSNKILASAIGVDIKLGKSIEVISNAENLPFKNNSIHLLYSRRCIQHIKNDVDVFKEIHRILTKDGRFVLLLASWQGWLFYNFKWILRKKPYPFFHMYFSRHLKNKLQSVGFNIEKFSMIRGKKVIGMDYYFEVTKKD